MQSTELALTRIGWAVPVGVDSCPLLQRTKITDVVGVKKMYRGLSADVVQLIRLGSFALLAAILAAWISGEAFAKAAVRLHHAQRSLFDTQATLPANGEQHSPMRYHGGPKSPMWH